MNVNWSRIIGNIGRTLIGTGTLILLFVVYQLWGTALQERRAQSSLRDDFAAQLESTGVGAEEALLDEVALPASLDVSALVPAASTTDDTTPEPASGESAADAEPEVSADQIATAIDTSFLPEGVLSSDHGPPPPPPENGDAIAEIRIPRIGVTKTVVEGVTTEQLKKGPGHYPGTPLPGQAGNSSIAGHRTTYGAPFNELDELETNDLIYVTTLQGSFVYRVIDQLVVTPKDVWVLDPSDSNLLTLTTCHPKYSARERLVVVAELIGEPAESDPGQSASSGEIELASEDVGEEAAGSTTTTSEPEGADGDDGLALAAPTSTPPTSATPTTTEAVTAAPAPTEVAHGGLDGTHGARWPAFVLGFLAAAIAFGIWYLAEHWRKWTSYLVGAPIFLIALFFFFEAFSALLPPGV